MNLAKRPRLIFGLITLLIVAGIGLVVWSARHPYKSAVKPQQNLPKTQEGQKTPTPSPAFTGTPVPIAKSTTPKQSTDGVIRITTPTQGSTVSSGSTVTGTAQVAANQLYFRLKGAQSGQLAQGSISFNGSASAPASYSFELAFSNEVKGSPDQGELEVYVLNSAGVESSIASVAVNIQ